MSGAGWTKPGDVIAVLRRRWNTGAYLRSYLRGEPWEPVILPVKRPGANELLHRFEDARKWAASFEADLHPSLLIEYRMVGGRHVGANRVPASVEVPDFSSLCSALRTSQDVRVLDEIMDRTRSEMPSLEQWSMDHPLALLEYKDSWCKVLATAKWIISRETVGSYLRQIDVEGVDTKFVERHQKLLSQLLPHILPPGRVNHAETNFARRFGFLAKPTYVRLRFLDPGLSPFPPGISEVTLRASELAGIDPGAATVFVMENEVTYLAFPDVPGGIAIFGSGFASSGLSDLPWLGGKEVIYWGDIDTHGFHILSRLRAQVPQVRSILMDRETLLSHRDHWSLEASPARRLPENLTDLEQALYQDLAADIYGRGVRLEQERVRFSRLQATLAPWNPQASFVLP